VDLIAERFNTDIAALSVRVWAMYFDGSACGHGCGIGILLVSPRGAMYSFSIRLPTACTNNLAEYEAVRKGMELLLEARAEAVEIFGDSKLVISQLIEEYRCESELLFPLWVQCEELMAQFRYINFYWIPRTQNSKANDLAQMASGYKAVTQSRSSGTPTGSRRLKSRYLKLLEGFGSGGTQEDILQGHEIRPDRG
jgi:ribonuclease HI